MQTFLCTGRVKKVHSFEGVMEQWCNSLTLQLEQSGGVGSIPGRTQSLEHRDKRSALFCDPSAWR